jgi:hypothetical protein
MSNIILKKSSVTGKIPGIDDLNYGELAINYQDGKIFYKTASNEIKSFLDSDNIEQLVNYANVNFGINLGSDSNQPLDYYDENTFTPEIVNNSISYNVQNGEYTRIGNMVHVDITIDVSSLDKTDTSTFKINALPFLPKSDINPLMYTVNAGRSNLLNGPLELEFESDNSSYLLGTSQSGVFVSYDESTFNSSGQIFLSLSYRTS